MHEVLRLSTGKLCVLHSPAVPFVAHYHVLSLPEGQGAPSEGETEELLLLASRKARELGRRCFGDEECFSIVYNGGRTRRKPWPHVHILPARSTAAKRVAFLAFSLKGLLRPLLGPAASSTGGRLGPWRR
jgi:hypothetical protein